MKPFALAVVIGVLFEAAMAASFVSGVGPCGPATTLSSVALKLHWFPGGVLADGLTSVIELPEVAYLSVIVISQCLLWIAIAYAVIRVCSRSRA